jgi:Striatin family
MNHPSNTNAPPQQPPQQQQQQQPFANGSNGNGNNAGNLNGNGNGTTSANGDYPVANYSLQGVMQWLNGEYRRYERDRNNWEIERSALVVFILVVRESNGRLKYRI